MEAVGANLSHMSFQRKPIARIRDSALQRFSRRAYYAIPAAPRSFSVSQKRRSASSRRGTAAYRLLPVH